MLVERPDHMSGIAQVREHEPRIHDVEYFRGRLLPDIKAAKLHVLHALLRRLRPGELQLRVVDVDANDPAAWTDPARELERRVSSAAADVKAGEPILEVKPVEEGHRRRTHDASEDAKPFPALETASNHVMSGIRPC